MRDQAKFRVILASGSRFFLGGIRRILEGVGDIEIIAEAFTLSEIETTLSGCDADFLFLDNRILRIEMTHILNFSPERGSSTRVILLDTATEADTSVPGNIIKMNREADSQELISLIRESTERKNQTKNIKAEAKDYELTRMELRVIELVAHSRTNRHIANMFSISESTVKAHLTSIFKKLGIQNRYQLQLMTYRKALIPNLAKNTPLNL